MKAQSIRVKEIKVRNAERSVSLAEKDWFRAIMIWLLLEGVCFGLAPYWNIISPGDRWHTWFIASIPFGIVGAILIGLSSQSIEHFNSQRTSATKRSMIFLGQLMGGTGLAFILFPLLMVFTEFIAKATLEIMERGS